MSEPQGASRQRLHHNISQEFDKPVARLPQHCPRDDPPVCVCNRSKSAPRDILSEATSSIRAGKTVRRHGIGSINTLVRVFPSTANTADCVYLVEYTP